jgi:hypothetical protein
MTPKPIKAASTLNGKIPFRALLILTPVIFACAVWANLSFAITDPNDFRFIPPFERGVNVNANKHLGGEYFQIAKALVAGNGFADPMDQPSGATAWQPPVYPLLMAGLLWILDGSREAVMAVVLFLQVYVLIATGLLVVALAAGERRGVSSTVIALIIYLAVILWNFKMCFQFTHDCWIVLLGLDIIIAGFCWFAPLTNWRRALLWGLTGGFCAMIGPIVGFTWGMLTLVSSIKNRAWSRLTLAMLGAALALAPWTIRNFLVFERFIPVKSNLAFEMFQSQILQEDGLLRRFQNHPYGSGNSEGRLYREIGEMKYLDLKRQQFWQSVANDPFDFADRVALRFWAATFKYVPLQGSRQLLWLRELTHPIPFLAFLFLLYSTIWKPLHWAQWTVLGVYVFYLLPYILVSYYDRYGLPLLGVKVILVVWAGERLLSMLRNWRGPKETKEKAHAKRTTRQQPAKIHTAP